MLQVTCFLRYYPQALPLIMFYEQSQNEVLLYSTRLTGFRQTDGSTFSIFRTTLQSTKLNQYEAAIAFSWFFSMLWNTFRCFFRPKTTTFRTQHTIQQDIDKDLYKIVYSVSISPTGSTWERITDTNLELPFLVLPLTSIAKKTRTL